jgi:uncharacterized DUF497 family protein
VQFEWDEKKRRANLQKHGVDFLDANEIFAGITVTIADDRFDYGEQRFISFGLLRERVVAVAHAEKPDALRIISIRKATKNESKAYFAQVAHGFPAT